MVVNRWISFWKALQSPDYPHDEDGLRRLLSDNFHRNYSPGGTLRQLKAILATGSLNHWLREIRCPTQIIHGLQDPLIRPAAAKAIHKRIKSFRIHLIPGMGHDLPEALIPDFIRIMQMNSVHG
jgi:pimeloyl-ACP methyl ester carboxylesterase